MILPPLVTLDPAKSRHQIHPAGFYRIYRDSTHEGHTFFIPADSPKTIIVFREATSTLLFQSPIFPDDVSIALLSSSNVGRRTFYGPGPFAG